MLVYLTDVRGERVVIIQTCGHHPGGLDQLTKAAAEAPRESRRCQAAPSPCLVTLRNLSAHVSTGIIQSSRDTFGTA